VRDAARIFFRGAWLFGRCNASKRRRSGTLDKLSRDEDVYYAGMDPIGIPAGWKRILRIAMYAGALMLMAYGCFQAYTAYEDIRDFSHAFDILAENPTVLKPVWPPF
jgi:hypothetical protein